MDLLVKCTRTGTTNTDETITKAFGCLSDFCRILYEFLGKYIEVIVQLSLNVISNGSDACKIPAMEMWNVISQEFTKRKNLISSGRGDPNHQIEDYILPYAKS